MSGMRKGTKQKYDEIAALFREGKTRREIGEKLHYSRATVERVIRQYGLSPKQETFEEHKEEIIEMRKNGLTYQEIADETGLSMSTVSRNMQYMDVKRGDSGQKKEIRHAAIRARAEAPEEDLKPKQYAKDMRQVRRIEVRGKRYKDVTDYHIDKGYSGG